MKVLKSYNIRHSSLYWRRYRDYIEDIPLFFKNTHTVFDKLRTQKRKIGFVTSLKKEFAISLLSHHNLERYAKVIITPSECNISKPNPQSILMAIGKIAVQKQEAIYVGDQATDIRAAKRAGCKAGFASWGGLSLTEDNPDIILRTLYDVTRFLRR